MIRVEWLQLIIMMFQSILMIVINPLFWLVLVLIYIQYNRVAKMEKKLIGETKATTKQRMLTATGAGFIGGIMGTIVISILGVTVQIKDFRFILPLAIILMMINVRYLCFSYAGGIISLSSLIFGFPDINVSSIIAIVAVLHFIESILIWIDGHRSPTPIFTEHDIYGTVGAFTLQRFWPIPFAVMIIILTKIPGSTDLNLPDWWPLFIEEGLDIDNITLQLSVVMAALGYGDIAISSTPRQKAKKSSLRLALYSITLLILATLSSYIYIFKYIAAIFAPLAHEGLIIYSQREERNKRPLFKNSNRGLTVLDVKKGSVAEKIGLKPGHIIWSVNDYLINEKEDLFYVLRQIPTYIRIIAVNTNGNTQILEHHDFKNGITSLGAIIVPKEANVVVNTRGNNSIFKKIINKMRK